jgi:hypothetical protein
MSWHVTVIQRWSLSLPCWHTSLRCWHTSLVVGTFLCVVGKAVPLSPGCSSSRSCDYSGYGGNHGGHNGHCGHNGNSCHMVIEVINKVMKVTAVTEVNSVHRETTRKVGALQVLSCPLWVFVAWWAHKVVPDESGLKHSQRYRLSLLRTNTQAIVHRCFSFARAPTGGQNV